MRTSKTSTNLRRLVATWSNRRIRALTKRRGKKSPTWTPSHVCMMAIQLLMVCGNQSAVHLFVNRVTVKCSRNQPCAVTEHLIMYFFVVQIRVSSLKPHPASAGRDTTWSSRSANARKVMRKNSPIAPFSCPCSACALVRCCLSLLQ